MDGFFLDFEMVFVMGMGIVLWLFYFWINGIIGWLLVVLVFFVLILVGLNWLVFWFGWVVLIVFLGLV